MTKATEERLEELRRLGAEGKIEAPGVRPEGSPFPSYYGQPLLKPPVWTWEIPIYFFLGGAGGIAAMLGVAAQLTGGDERLVRDARLIAAIGANASVPLLISDLGRPMRFLNMLRVFKPQSPMSVGAWTLMVFGTTSTVAVFFRHPSPGPRHLLGDAAALLSAISGLGMATYTGVLLGATAIPAWNAHAATLPIHFAASSLGSAVALLELRGHRTRALTALAIGAAAFESYTAYELESGDDAPSRPLRRGATGLTTAVGAALSGPIPLVLRLLGGRNARQAAAVSSILGSLLTRFAWVEAGKESARDPRAALG